MVLLAFRHGLRASELVDLRWEQVDLEKRASSLVSNFSRPPAGFILNAIALLKLHKFD